MIILFLLLITLFSCSSNESLEEEVFARVGDEVLIKKNIIDTYESAKVQPRMKILNYFIKNRCKLLIECIEDF